MNIISKFYRVLTVKSEDFTFRPDREKNTMRSRYDCPRAEFIARGRFFIQTPVAQRERIPNAD